MPKKTALYLISGFLGSGKTTLVKRLLDDAAKADAKVGIIVNEFGKVSIDGPIIKKSSVEMIELTRGSIFCSCLKKTFVEALIEMAAKDLDCLVVEGSGLADPSNIGEILDQVSAQIANPYVYSGSITVVDAGRFLSEFASIETIVKQIECSDLTLINKVDLVTPDTIEEIKTKIKEINPDTVIKTSSFFNEVLNILGNDLSGGKYPELRSTLNTPENKPKSISITFEGEVKKEDIAAFVKEIMEAAFRVKGFIRADDQWWEVHGVGANIDFYETDHQLELSTLVIISKVGPQVIRVVDAAWKKYIGIPMKIVNG